MTPASQVTEPDFLDERVADMFAYLEKHDWEGTIECNPERGQEGDVIQRFLDRGRAAGICVHTQIEQGLVTFYAHKQH